MQLPLFEFSSPHVIVSDEYRGEEIRYLTTSGEKHREDGPAVDIGSWLEWHHVGYEEIYYARYNQNDDTFPSGWTLTLRQSFPDNFLRTYQGGPLRTKEWARAQTACVAYITAKFGYFGICDPYGRYKTSPGEMWVVGIPDRETLHIIILDLWQHFCSSSFASPDR